VLRALTGSTSAVLETARERALADPLSLDASTSLQQLLHASGRVDEAEAEYRRSRDLQGDRTLVESLAVIRAAVEGYDRSVVMDRNARLRAVLPSVQQAAAFDPAAFLDDPDAALPELRAELGRVPDPGALSPFMIALWADYFGDADLALEALATSYRLLGVVYTNPWDGALRRVRGHPGFKDLMRELGYEAYWRETGEWGDHCRPVGEDDFECS
jgi:hypothetical protein